MIDPDELLREIKKLRKTDPLWPQFGPGIEKGPVDRGRMAARAAHDMALDEVEDLVRSYKNRLIKV